MDFTTYTFPVYQVDRHLELLAAELEAAEQGEVARLMVFMPPRHGKSELASVRFPAWYLGRNPNKRVILASYGANLAHRFSRQVRNLITHPLYANIFGERSAVVPPLTLSEDSAAAEAWDLAPPHRGGMVAAGIGGGITGHGAHLLIIDDPVKDRKEANSATMRQTAWDWYRSVAYTRLEEDAVVVLIQTRWHMDDLAGRLLAAEGEKWRLLHLPALDDEGRALWPEKYPAEVLTETKASIGSWEFEALYQGRPRPLEGALFKHQWFRIVEAAPEGLRWARFWDLAASVRETGSCTASAKCALAEDGTLYISDVIRGRWEWPDARKVIVATALADGASVELGVEKVAFQLAAVQELRRLPELAGHTIREATPDTDKVARANPWAARAEAGKVALVMGPWVPGFLAEVCDFPLGEHDDQVDAVSGAVAMVSKPRIKPASVQREYTAEEYGRGRPRVFGRR